MFEVHLTVPLDTNVDALRRLYTNGKVHSFTNRSRGWKAPDVMTSLRTDVRGLSEALQIARADADGLEVAGFRVLRTKIETVPWTDLPALYLETHLRVLGGRNYNRLWLWSTNNRGREYVTVRTRNLTLGEHLHQVNFAVKVLLTERIQVVGEPETEAAVYDNNPEHDAEWERRSCM